MHTDLVAYGCPRHLIIPREKLVLRAGYGAAARMHEPCITASFVHRIAIDYIERFGIEDVDVDGVDADDRSYFPDC
jgi:hypothetical protein